MVWTKICGITSIPQAQLVVECRPSAIGLNFYSKSKRKVSPETATEIVQSLPDDITAVGLFVNQSAEDVMGICLETGIRTLQLHGDEDPQFLARLRDIAEARISTEPLHFFRVFRMGESGLPEMTSDLKLCSDLGLNIDAVLIDSAASGAYGGTGHTVPWDLLASEYPQQSTLPLILAGGLTAENVAEAIRISTPYGVDTASGVESVPGVKDASMVSAFVTAANL